MKASNTSKLKWSAVALAVLATCSSADARKSSDKNREKKPDSPAAQSTSALDVELVETVPTQAEGREVVASLKRLLKGIANRDLRQIGSCLSEEVTMFDARKNKLLYGKKDVLEHVRNNVVGAEGTHPVKQLKVYNPFVTIKGDTAMVSFKAMKELSDPKSTKLVSWCSEVFERKGGEWIVLQLRTNWEPIKGKESI